MTDAHDTVTVLVAYATGQGSTRGVAERIADDLRAAGCRVELRPVDGVDGTDAYDAVVFGSPVYDQSWLPEGERFLRANADALARRPVWLFSVGAFGDTHRVLGGLVKRSPRQIGELRATLHPRGDRFFAGAVQRHQWPWYGRLLFRAFGGRFGDNRDWRAIDGWAQEIARALRSSNSG
jgi:menaquinone-dependent protoporphyrinogen oxidase